MPTDTKLSVDQEAADVVRDEKRHLSAIEQTEVTNSAVIRLAFAFLRAFADAPGADAIVSAWRSQINRRAASRG